MPRVSERAKLIAAMWLAEWEIITPLGMAVVPDVNSISQMSSPWISTTGSSSAWASTNAPNPTLPDTTSPPIAIVTSGASPARAKASAARGQHSASTIANVGSAWRMRCSTTSGARFGLSGIATRPALAMPIFATVGLDGVLAEQQYPGGRFEAAGEQAVGDLVGDPVGLAVGHLPEPFLGVGARAAGDRDLIGIAPGHPLEDVADGGAFPAVHRASAAQGGDVEPGERSDG